MSQDLTKADLIWSETGGGRGIRTLGRFPHNSFQDYPIQPLWHPSAIGK